MQPRLQSMSHDHARIAMYPRILVPVDASPCSITGLNEALQLAGVLNAGSADTCRQRVDLGAGAACRDWP